MSFIRVKEIGKKGKKYRYAYLVSNVWRKRLKGGKKGSRQKVSKYLGKVINFDKEKDRKNIGFFEFVNIKENAEYLENSKARIIRDLTRYELFIRGFGERKGRMEREGFGFDLRQRKFVDDSGEEEEKIVVEMNEGFLCKYTIAKLLNFKSKLDDEREIGIELAKAFLEAGFNVPKEVFIGYFEKI